MRVTALLVLVGCAASGTSSSDEALTCGTGAPGALGNACVKTADPTPINTNATISANQLAYGVRLVPGSGGNRATLHFTAPQTGTYSFYLSAPNIPVRVRASNGTTVQAQCASTITATQCSSLRLVQTYNLRGGTAYSIALGPVSSTYVRLYIQSQLADPPVCPAGTLTEQADACSAADQGSEPVSASALSAKSPPVIVEDTVYTVTLPSTGGSNYGGVFRFTAANDGDRELYLGTPNIPLRVVDEGGAAELVTCTRYIPASECDRLRRGDLFTMRAGHTYRFELGPATNTHYVRVTLREASAASGTVKLGPPQSYGAGTTPYFVTAGDLNNDGSLDLAVSSPDDASGMTEIDLLQGNGAGAFTMVNRVSTSAPAESVIDDFNHDGIRDVVAIANDGQGPLPDPYLQGNGNFMYTTTIWGHARDFLPRLSAGDFNEDGTIDLVAAYFDSEFGTGAAGFVIETMPADVVLQDEFAFGADTVQAIAGDFNGDGHQDVVAASRAASAVKLYLGNGTGTVAFAQDLGLPGDGIRAIAAFDLDRDGYSDLVATHFDGTTTVSRGTATGFAAAQILAASGSGIAAGDFDHDGRIDLALSSLTFSATTVQIFLGTATGFTSGGTLSAPSGTGVNLAVGDYNGDGFDDLAAPSLSSVTVWLSTP